MPQCAVGTAALYASPWPGLEFLNWPHSGPMSAPRNAGTGPATATGWWCGHPHPNSLCRLSSGLKSQAGCAGPACLICSTTQHFQRAGLCPTSPAKQQPAAPRLAPSHTSQAAHTHVATALTKYRLRADIGPRASVLCCSQPPIDCRPAMPGPGAPFPYPGALASQGFDHHAQSPAASRLHPRTRCILGP